MEVGNLRRQGGGGFPQLTSIVSQQRQLNASRLKLLIRTNVSRERVVIEMRMYFKSPLVNMFHYRQHGVSPKEPSLLTSSE